MSAWRTALAGMLGLALLDAAVSSQRAAGRVGGLLSGVATVVEHVLSPTVAAVPDLRTRGGPVIREADAQPSAGSLLPADWTTKPTAPAAPPPGQLYA